MARCVFQKRFILPRNRPLLHRSSNFDRPIGYETVNFPHGPYNMGHDSSVYTEFSYHNRAKLLKNRIGDLQTADLVNLGLHILSHNLLNKLSVFYILLVYFKVIRSK